MTRQVHPDIRRVQTELLSYLKAGAPQGRTFGHFMAKFGLVGGCASPDGRVMDRALQGLKKERCIKYEGRQWWLR